MQREKYSLLLILLITLSVDDLGASEIVDKLINKKEKDGECIPEPLVNFIEPWGGLGSPILKVKGTHSLDVITFKEGDSLFWSKRECFLNILMLVDQREFGGYKWLGLDAFTDKKDEYLNVAAIFLHRNKFLPSAGVLSEKVTQGGKEYVKGELVCVNEEADITNSFHVNMYNFEHNSSLNFHRDNRCIVNNGELSKDTKVEGVMWKKGTSFKFDKNGKWVYVRVRPGQKYEGKVYKDGAKFFRGKDYSSHKDGSLQIMTPEDDMYDKVIVD